MTALAQAPPAPVARLPPLRRDLVVELAAGPDRGLPSIIVTDPVRGAYFRLAWPQSGIFLHWEDVETADELSQTLAAAYGMVTTEEQISSVAQFAFSNHLTQADQDGSWRRYSAQLKASRQGWLKTIIHGYLFFRAPLLHPDRRLKQMLPYLSWLFTRTFWIVIALIALLGLHLATRQWTAVVSAAQSAAQDVLRLEGLGIYAAALLGLKAIHELGHALAAARFGCRVPGMGVAVMLGMPLFYTDTSGSWRLSNKSERLKIVFAGVAAELIVATAALHAWSLLPDGRARQICFALATTSLVLTLLVNLNPLMRFDGYYALSDYLGVPNLQSRGFKLGTWKLRELLFGLRREPPVKLVPRLHRIVIVYAWISAVYRFFLFLGIAAIVYAVAGKAIGIVLGLIEIVIFIALPVFREFKTWWQMRMEILQHKRIWMTIAALAGVAALVFAPWVSTIEVPAVLVADKEEAIYLPFAAKLESIGVSNGQFVQAGDVLFTASATDLNQQFAKAALEQGSLEFQAARLHASEEQRAARGVIVSRLERAREKVDAIERLRGQLVIRAPFGGRAVDVDAKIRTGLWLNQKRLLARVVTVERGRVLGLVPGGDVERVKRGARAVFIPDNAAAASLDLVVAAIAPASDGRLAEASLADRHGGSIAANDKQGDLVTRNSWFEVQLEMQAPAPAELMRGVVRIEAASVSPFAILWRQIARTMVREQSF